MYEDDRTSTTSLSDNSYSLITFKGDATLDEITITADAKGTYKDAPKSKQMKFVIHLVNGNPSEVLINGKKASGKTWKYDRKTSTVTVNTPWNVADSLTVTIK